MTRRIISNYSAALFVFFSLVFVLSCKKENSTSDAEQEQASLASSEGDVQAEETFNNTFDDVMGANNDVGISGTGIFFGRSDTLVTGVPPCFTVTITHPSTSFFPVIIVVDFGTTGCTGPDGRTRRGKVRTEYTARLINPGAVATTTFDGFYVNDVHVEGTHRITNITAANTAQRKFKVEVIDGKLTRPNGNYVKWNSTKTVTQVEGNATATPLDDIYKIEGGAHGQALRGNLLVAWESTITEPLYKRVTCRWIVRGKIKTVRISSTTANSWVAVLDFGNGTCDDQAVITINGVSHQITLP